jgi:hypothetical protein
VSITTCLWHGCHTCPVLLRCVMCGHVHAEVQVYMAWGVVTGATLILACYEPGTWHLGAGIRCNDRVGTSLLFCKLVGFTAQQLCHSGSTGIGSCQGLCGTKPFSHTPDVYHDKHGYFVGRPGTTEVTLWMGVPGVRKVSRTGHHSHAPRTQAPTQPTHMP